MSNEITDQDLDVLIKYLDVPHDEADATDEHLTLDEWDVLLHETATEERLAQILEHLNECPECRLTLDEARAYEAECAEEDRSQKMEGEPAEVITSEPLQNILHFYPIRRGRSGTQHYKLAAGQQAETGWSMEVGVPQQDGHAALRIQIGPEFMALAAMSLQEAGGGQEVTISLGQPPRHILLTAGKPVSLGSLKKLGLTDQSSDEEIREALTRLQLKRV